ncbi:NAD(P)H dehydrogenase (quinone) [Tenacibaculum sp. KUL113]|nr:NAD(P)H dehydrogenase (quinone) [Tenacibaculum sp. KUL113]
MNILLIVAHPKKESFSFAMAERILKQAYEKKHNIDMIDLYRDKNQQPFFSFNNANNVPITKEMKYYQDKIKNSDRLIFIFPYWWGGMPSILKNFIEWNLSKGFAFKYVNSKPVGLLSNKEVSVYTTTGAPSFIYKITGANSRIKKTFKQQIINFCGMKLISFNIYGGLDKSNINTEKILEKIVL